MFAETVTFTDEEVTLIVLALLAAVVIIVAVCSVGAWIGSLIERFMVTGTMRYEGGSGRPGLPALIGCGAAAFATAILFWPLPVVTAPVFGGLASALKRRRYESRRLDGSWGTGDS